MRAADAVSIEDLRRLARRRLPRAVFDFFDGGAEDEITLRDNRAAFERVRLLPRVLIDVERVDTRSEVLGAASALPLAVGPTGGVGFGWPGGDIAIARAAAKAGVPCTLSTAATATIEQVAEQAGGRLWFQAYALRERALFERLVERASAAGYEALMITVDLPVGGKRERDLRNHFAQPFRPGPSHLIDFMLHVRWIWRIARHGMPVLANLVDMAASAPGAAEAGSTVARGYDASFDWQRLQRLRERWPRKLIVKGVAHPQDAERLAALGVDAIVVSNHGGRQLDGAVATLDALPAVVAAVPAHVPVMIDGGVRRGADVVKALALGATAVLIGRATLYGALAGGEPGAARALEILRDEFARTLRLCGLTEVAGIGRELLQLR